MKILVLNSGSSSVKYKLIDLEGKESNTLAEGGVEKIGLPGGFLKFKKADGSKATDELGLIDHQQAVKAILNKLTDPVAAAQAAAGGQKEGGRDNTHGTGLQNKRAGLHKRHTP